MADRVLITGARALPALDIARSLRAAGFEPHLADCSPAWVARFSNSGGPVHRYASPVHRPAQFGRDLRRLIARLDSVIVIPTCEEVFHLAALMQEDGVADRLFAPPLDRLATLHAKDRFAALCERLSLPVPETVVVSDRTALEAWSGTAGDHVFKPVWSRFGSRALIGPDPAEVAGITPTPAEPWVVQRRIMGEEVSFYAVCHQGRVVAFSAWGSDWRLPGGASYAFRPLPEDRVERLRPLADALAGFVGTGQVSCDAIIDAGGRPWLIECNPRATSGVHLFGRSAAFGTALLGRGEAVPAAGARHVGPALWHYGLPAARREGRLHDWRVQRRDGHDVVTAPGDPWPALGLQIDATVFGLRALRAGLPFTMALTGDIEWNGAPLPRHL